MCTLCGVSHVNICACQRTISSIILHKSFTLFLLRHCLSLAWGLAIRLGWLARKPQRSTCFCLSRPRITYVHHHRAWISYMGSRTQGLMLTGRHLTDWPNSPALQNIYIKEFEELEMTKKRWRLYSTMKGITKVFSLNLFQGLME